MGTHQNGPAHLFSNPSTPLLSVISSQPKHYLGEALLRKWPGTTHIPYLFKILSCQKALPLQVHPDKELAKHLSEKDPEAFVDPNHKPEIAVSIGEPIDNGAWGEGIAFTGFVGFQPIGRIREYIKSIPELRGALGNDPVAELFVSCKPDEEKERLKQIYSLILRRPQNEVARHVRSLVDRIGKGDWPSDPTSKELGRLVIKVNAQYPGDVGVFSTVFFMNFIKLQRGESVYIGADEIHAYLEGDIIECMAISDNVLNVAFVPPEERQVDDFLRALTFTARDKDHWLLSHESYSKSKEGKTQVYAPPCEEFIVLGTSLGKDGMETLGAVGGPTIGIVTQGRIRVIVGKEREELDTGGIIFVAPGNEIQVEHLERGAEGEIWWASTVV
ncbi:hypothetical protein PHLCEN_2v13696 [Hermanssonia centrifuga]|uniref:Mannose-6-phosphate isomerase n=1 Tax=Hermanssonia centrifuga TaxID=98765 RepID=A0A2R6NDL8_9APHY|nr:hypothetical protein PHLCEN_2v13696 [Hermanssonia centrifuga]